VRRNLAPADLGDLLDRPLVAVLATCRADASVLLSPVWHEWRDDGFDVVTSSDDVKVRHLRRDPRASIAVYEHQPPYRGIEVRCRARLDADAAPAALARIAVRYLGPEAGHAYIEVSADDMLIRLEPGNLRAWDFADDDALSV
jgi:PPOX class probable F420-dependent enzyme